VDSYEVTCQPAGRGWLLTIPAIEGAVTQAENLEQVPFMAAGAIDGLSGQRPTRLRLTGDAVTNAYRERPPVDGPEIDEALRVGFPHGDAADLSEAIAVHGHWDWTPDDEGITCTRR
jgi:hypothetical protein